MSDGQAKIIVGTSPVAADRRHAYLLFERSDGSQIVVRGGPGMRAEGNDLANFAESTLLGSKKFGNIQVDSAPYVAPYTFVIQRQADGSDLRIPAEQADPGDPSLKRNAQGQIIVGQQIAPDWPLPGETHERIVVWKGTDQELVKKLDSALTAGQQINDAKLEYSPLYNNSNGVASTLLKSAGVAPSLPLGKDGSPVSAPNFGESLYQDVGLASSRSGYWFDGSHWYDNDDRKIRPPQSGEPTVPLDSIEKNRSRPDSFDSSFNLDQEGRQQGRQAFSTGDPDLDRLAAALAADDETAISHASSYVAQSPQVQAFEQWGRELVATQQREEIQQRDAARQMQGPGIGL